MNYETVKRVEDVKLVGCKVSFERRNGSLYAVRIVDANGGELLIARAEYSGIDLYQPAEQEDVSRANGTAVARELPEA